MLTSRRTALAAGAIVMLLAGLAASRVKARPSHQLSYSAASGPTYAWEGAASGGSLNSGNGNKLTSIPLFGWTAKGGMPINMALVHNSQSSHNSELGQKWTHSFDLYGDINETNGNFTMHWGNDLSYVFTKSGSTFSPPTGIHDTLVGNGSPVTSYDLTTPGQIKYHFTNPNGTAWLCASITDPNSNSISLTWNSSNYCTAITDPSSRTISLTYTSSKISSITDPQSRVWSVSYTSGDLTQIDWPSVGGTVYNMQFGYNGNHDITSLTDKRGNSWSFTYFSDDSINTETAPGSLTTTYSYTSGQTVITDPNSHVTKHNYTSGRLSSTVDQLNNTESYSYDSSNNRTGMTDRRSNSWSWTFDSTGNVLTATDPLSHTTTWTYNSKNRPLTVTDHAGDKVVNTFDSTLNWNLTQTQQKDSSNNVLSTTSFTYNSDGTVATKVDSNSHTTSYGYNSNGHLTSVTTPNSRVTNWTVNTLGVTTGRTDALSRSTSDTLDNWNRVTTTTYPDSSTNTFQYDANSNLTQFVDANGTTTRAYDSNDRITSESFGGSTVCSYSYDATGKKGLLSSITDASSRTVTYTYTSRNELYTVGDSSGTATYSYDNDGNETGTTNQNSSTVTKVFDNANRLTSVTNKNSGGTTLSSFSYAYSTDDLRTSCTESNGDVVSYGYDAAHRLTSESRTGNNSYSKTYSVDGVGNRTSQTVGGNTTNFSYSTDDELASTSGNWVTSYSYNANGEQTSRTQNGVTYTQAFDYDGQMTSIYDGTNTNTFAYDAVGRRFSRTSGGTTTKFLYGAGGILLEKQGSTYTATYTIGNAPVRKDGEYPMIDGLGSERTVCNSSQTVTGTAIYEGFGQVVATTGSSSNSYMFAGESGYRNDNDAGLLHVGARYYDARTGRFLSRDRSLNQNPFLYCVHDPINHLDPDGRDWYYHSGSGSISRHVGIKVFVVGVGYSGAPGHVNRPSDDHMPGLGPIPQGQYTIGDPEDGGHMGAFHLPLTPAASNEMHGRSGFFIHGDNSQHNQSASEGCIILPRSIRTRIDDSGDTTIHVIP